MRRPLLLLLLRLGQPLLLVAGALGSGCAGSALLQTARTVPAGEVRGTVGMGFVYNELVQARGLAVNNFPVVVGVRYGLGEHTDLGLRNLSSGLVLDAKHNFLAPESPLAVALLGGVGGVYGGTNVGDTSAVHVPLGAVASYDLGPVTPYAAVGYGAWWFIHPIQQTPGVAYAKRTWTGDGTLELRAGLELRVSQRVAILAEYGYTRPLVEDPGDNFSLVPSHQLAMGVRF